LLRLDMVSGMEWIRKRSCRVGHEASGDIAVPLQAPTEISRIVGVLPTLDHVGSGGRDVRVADTGVNLAVPFCGRKRLLIVVPILSQAGDQALRRNNADD